MTLKPFPYYPQLYQMDCGLACLRMVAEYYGKMINPYQKIDISRISHKGISLLEIINEAEKMGFRAIALKIRRENLAEINLPIILHWNQNHFVVLFEIKDDQYYIADPARGIVSFYLSDFLIHWQDVKSAVRGVAILLTLSTSCNL